MFRLARLPKLLSGNIKKTPTRLFRPFSTRFHKTISSQVEKFKSEFKGSGRVISIVEHSRYTKIEVFTTKQGIETEFGVEIDNVGIQRKQLESILPRLNKFVDCVRGEMITELKDNMIRCNDYDVDTKDVTELSEMKDREKELDECLKYTGHQMSCLYECCVKFFEIMKDGISIVKINQPPNIALPGNKGIEDYLLYLMRFIRKIETELDWIIDAQKQIIQYVLKFERSSQDLLPYIVDVFTDYVAIVKMLNPEDDRQFEHGIAFLRIVKKSLQNDWHDLLRMEEISRTRDLSAEEERKISHITEKWMKYIDKCTSNPE
jgi:hypothetical protein